MKYNINNVEALEDVQTVEKFPTKKGPKKMRKHPESEEKKKDRHARKDQESMEAALSSED